MAVMGKPTRQSGLRPGQLVRVPVGEHFHTYGRLLSTQPYLAFYDCRTEHEDPPSVEIVSCPVLFVVATVYQPAVKEGRWVPLDVVPLRDFDVEVPLRFHQPEGAADELSIVDGKGNVRSATPAECEGLERALVWVPRSVEDRLCDHYRGVPNAFVDIFRGGQ